MMGSTQENGRTVPFELDGKRKGVKDRLRNIDTAMAWIRGELVSWRWLVGGKEGGHLQYHSCSDSGGIYVLGASFLLGIKKMACPMT